MALASQRYSVRYWFCAGSPGTGLRPRKRRVVPTLATPVQTV